jgi:hypothetical protein
MVVLVYFILFLALSAALLRWQTSSMSASTELAPQQARHGYFPLVEFAASGGSTTFACLKCRISPVSLGRWSRPAPPPAA